MKPTIGRIVHYKLNDGDVAYIDDRTPIHAGDKGVHRNSVKAGDVYMAKPDPPYAWYRSLGRLHVGRTEPKVTGRGLTVTRHFADFAIAGRYVGICWR